VLALLTALALGLAALAVLTLLTALALLAVLTALAVLAVLAHALTGCGHFYFLYSGRRLFLRFDRNYSLDAPSMISETLSLPAPDPVHIVQPQNRAA
jgi:hypothetical protein